MLSATSLWSCSFLPHGRPYGMSIMATGMVVLCNRLSVHEVREHDSCLVHCIRNNDDPGWARLRVLETQLELRRIDALEQSTPRTNYSRKDRKLELVDEVVIDQRLIEHAGPVLDDPLAWCLFEPRHFSGHVTADRRGVPCGGLQRR